MLFSCYGTGQPSNLAQYSNPKVDSMIDELMHTEDKSAYDTLLKETLKVIVDDAGSFCAAKGASFSAFNKDLKVPTCDTGLVRFADLSW